VTAQIERFAGSPSEWDELVRTCEGRTHFHRYGWRGIFESVFGHECLYLAARDEPGRLSGVLPLVRVQSLLFGHFLVSVPFLNYGGPLGSDEAVKALAAAAADEAQRGRVGLLELRSRRELPLDMPVSHRKITVVLDLPDDPAALFKSFEAKLRSQVRRPQKENVVVRFGPDQVRPFFDVFSAHMRDLGTPTLPRGFFEAILEQFPDTWFGCAWLGDKPVACGAGFRWDDEFEMTWASSLYAYNKLAPNMLLYWSFMERAVAEGVKLFNFGRCSPDGGTHRFKRQWGSRDEPLWWYQRARGARSATPSPDDGAYSWGPRIWRHLPLPLATALGPRIVRYIP
jgi:FemAB-related protein (PEP-CTERM system-associated)